MREVEFRGKRLDNGEWAYGYYAGLPTTSLPVTIVSHGDEFAEDTAPCIISIKKKQHPYFSSANPVCIVEAEQHPVNPATVGQCTGLRDEKGQEIYEGDIVSVYQVGRVVVEFQSGCFGADDGQGFAPFHATIWGCGGEVIGNIHDNPELLKEVS